MTTSSDSHDVQIGITTSVVVHLLLLILLSWFMGLDSAAWMLISKRAPVEEVPKVTLIFPDQFIAAPKLKPKLDLKQYLRTTQNEPAADVPAKTDFISDRNTKAASEKAPFPDGDKAMPTSKGVDRATMELANRDFNAGKTADDNAGKPAAPAPQSAIPNPQSQTQNPLSPLQPQEPMTVPQLKPKEVAKSSPASMAKMIEDMDKDAGRMDVTKLPLQVKKADAAPATPPPMQTPPEAPPPLASTDPGAKKRALENFSPMTRKANVKGTITNKGEDAVDAAATPIGKFMRVVTTGVEKKWAELRLKRADAITYGYIKVRFYVNREGHVEGLQFLEKSGNAIMDSFTLDAILAAEIPPIPKDLLPLLEDERFLVDYDFIIQ